MRVSVVGLCIALSSAAPAAQGDHLQAPDLRAIRAFNASFAAAVRAMNNEAILALWEDGGVAVLPGTAPIRGKAEMGTMLRSVAEAHPHAAMTTFSMECYDLEGSGRWASERCLEHQVITEQAKPTFDSWGNLLLVLHRQDSGEWQLSREMWSEAARPTGA